MLLGELELAGQLGHQHPLLLRAPVPLWAALLSPDYLAAANAARAADVAMLPALEALLRKVTLKLQNHSALAQVDLLEHQHTALQLLVLGKER